MLFNAFFSKPKLSFRSNREHLDPGNLGIPSKANLILNLILIALLLISLRLWHLSSVQYAEKLEESRKPQRKMVVEPAKRGTIRDRFNLPLAINKVRYQAAVIYAPIRSIPGVKTEYIGGKKTVKYKRKEYIGRLSELLSQELKLEKGRVEDLIHSKASLFFNIPYVIKEDISETEYYRLKMLEKDWPGVQAVRLPKRDYPRKRTASDIIGYMGAISKEEYELIIREMKGLKDFLTGWEAHDDPPLPEGFASPFEVEKRYLDLEELAYTAHDYVGKTGIEALFEEELRGFRGKKSYFSDSRGNFLKELPGSKAPLSGKRLLLSISSELQEYAEELLGQNETIRVAKVSGHGKHIANDKQPWIKGGAIVAFEPNTGEVLALASWPRFDPNDFILPGKGAGGAEKNKNINRWFENESYIAEIWDMKRPLERELFDNSSKKFFEDKLWLTWEAYLDLVLPENHPINEWLGRSANLENAIAILTAVDEAEKESGKPISLLLKSEQDSEEFLGLLAPLNNLIPGPLSPYGKLLLIDLCQIAVKHDRFDGDLVQAIGGQSLASYRDAAAAFTDMQEKVKGVAKDLYSSLYFQSWRAHNEKDFLKEKRGYEKLHKHYPKPYIDYLDEKEKELFLVFWQKNRLKLCLMALMGIEFHDLKGFSDALRPLVHENDRYAVLKNALLKLKKGQIVPYLNTFRTFQQLDSPLKGKYRLLRNGKGPALEKHLAAAFYPSYGFGTGRSQAFRQATTQGSLFKIVTAFEALSQQYAKKGPKATIKELNPLEMIDKIYRIGGKTHIGYFMDGEAIPQIYKGGRIPRSSLYSIGYIDLIRAIETSSNPYFSLLASDVLESPNDLARAAYDFSFGAKTGIDLPGEIAGKVPDDLEANRTGLYALAIGQHSLVVTPLQTAVMLASVVNGGKILKPQIVNAIAGAIPDRFEDILNPKDHFDYQDSLALIGINFPLFGSSGDPKKNQVRRIQTEVRRQIFIPESIRYILLEGMHKVVQRTHAQNLGSLSRLYSNHPEAISDYIDLKNQIIGKTSTAESMERIDLDEKEGTNLYTHVWFGGVAFEKDVDAKFEKPELVVVIYLKYGYFGKEAAPLASQIVKKWREIKKKRGAS